MSLQSQISDALLLVPSLVGLPITAFAVGSFWRRSPFVLAITGNRAHARTTGCRHAGGRPGVVPSPARRAGRGSARGRSADVEADGPNSFDRPALMAKAVL